MSSAITDVSDKLKVVDFKPKEPHHAEPDDAIIGILGDLIDMALAGELRNIAVAGVLDNGSVVTGYRTSDSSSSTFSLIGGLETLKQRIMLEAVD